MLTRACVVGISLFVVAACGDSPSDRSAAIQQENQASRDAAQEGRIDNPAALACIRANASDDEWAIIKTETGDAPAVLGTVLGRDETRRCFAVNNVVVYL